MSTTSETSDSQALRRLREITDRVPGIVFELRRETDGRISLPFVSGGSLEMSGVPSAEAEANPNALFSLIHPDDLHIVLGAMNSTSDRPTSLDYRAFHRDGRTRWVHSLATRRVEPDGAVIVTGCWQEYTREKELQDRLAQATEAAEAASRAKSDFLATMSHEIRTPMNAVLSFAYLGLQADPPPKLREHFARIESSARTLLSLIDDILDLSKVEAGKLHLEHTPFALSQVLDNLHSVVGLRAQEKGLHFAVEVDEDVPGTLVGDPLRLGQVLLNLGGNAVKFTREGEVVVRVGMARAEPEHSADQTMLEFSVRDSGIGLTQEQIGKLFQAFVQADSSTTREFGGTGLGLSICKRLVELMGGTIGVHSEPGQGSTFHFSARFDTPEAVSAKPGAAAEATVLAGLSVLVTDDHDINRQVVSELFGSVDVQVTLAASGAEAIEAAAAQRFDAIFMDLRMPGMDGIEATRRIRAQEAALDPALARRTPIIALTANVMAPDRERCLAAGMDAFVGKPIAVSELFGALARCTNRRVATPAVSATLPEPPLAPEAAFAAARTRFGHKPELYEALARRYIEGEDLSERLRAELAAQRFDAALLSAHTLKGFAAQVGAMQVSRLAAQIERSLETGLPTVAAIDALVAAVADSRLALMAHAEAGADAVPVVSASAASLRAELLRRLGDDDDAAYETFEALRAALGAAAGADLATIGRHIANLEYVQALALLALLDIGSD
ncbi:PAS domain-containing hybrid sensor histidine kinase/response regulator [Nevskia ramosa]|uniref:PAS domain-containing hybrid sensor histidine kinase/response regulator n=1 Tax=Nevskia ramosa TaxID=64002 RepID=UPI0003B34F71|nr:PAS domain-containing hybrid sensor histidine kinase/response regulator [Nevskia ramosa]